MVCKWHHIYLLSPARTSRTLWTHPLLPFHFSLSRSFSKLYLMSLEFLHLALIPHSPPSSGSWLSLTRTAPRASWMLGLPPHLPLSNPLSAHQPKWSSTTWIGLLLLKTLQRLPLQHDDLQDHPNSDSCLHLLLHLLSFFLFILSTLGLLSVLSMCYNISLSNMHSLQPRCLFINLLYGANSFCTCRSFPNPQSSFISLWPSSIASVFL